MPLRSDVINGAVSIEATVGGMGAAMITIKKKQSGGGVTAAAP